MKKKWLFLSFLMSAALLFFHLPAAGQEPGEERHEAESEPFHPYHTVSLVIGHAQVNEGVADGKNRMLSLPSWGVDYNFVFHPRWAVGLHTDIIIEEFLVEKHLGEEETEVIERSVPIAPAVVATYKLDRRRRWGLMFGAGAEFAGGGETFFLNRAGIEYALELPKRWELVGVLAYDIKWNAYDSWVVGLGIARAFGMPRE